MEMEFQKSCTTSFSYRHLGDEVQNDAGVVYRANCNFPEGPCPIKEIRNNSKFGRATVEQVNSGFCVREEREVEVGEEI